MKRPLLITDCDEVLLHMVSHFDAWLGEAHGIRFAFETGNFGEAMTEVASGDPVAPDRVWPLLEQFFRGEMHRQTLVTGALEALSIIERYGAGTTVFVDDLPVHHASVAKHAPEVYRLHMVAEPRLAPAVPAAEHAHARIDDWPTATGWILERLGQK